MADQIVITEKTSQAKDIRTAVGSRYGDILQFSGTLVTGVTVRNFTAYSGSARPMAMGRYEYSAVAGGAKR